MKVKRITDIDTALYIYTDTPKSATRKSRSCSAVWALRH